MKKYNSRKEVPEKYKWDLSIYFKNEQELAETFKNSEKIIEKLPEYRGCTKDAFKLKEFIDSDIKCNSMVENIYVYSFLIDDQELGCDSSIELKHKALNLINKYEIAISFFVPELLNLKHSEYESLVNNEILKDYKIYLDNVYREKEHILKEDEEKIITELVNSVNTFDDISSTMLNSLHNYGKIKLSDGNTEIISTNNFRKLTKDKDEKVRKKVYNSFNKKLDEYSSVNAMLLNNYVKLNSKIASIRKFPSSWDEKLFNLRMSDKVFKSLLNATENNIDILQKYYNLKREVLNLDILHQYDMNLEMSKTNKKYTIEESQELLLKALSPLGEDYINHFKKIFDDRHIDYCQYKGKRSGAYSASIADNDSRILMSFNEDLDSISTIAHEGGHDVHHQYIKENNPIIYRNVKTIVAEVASLTNECLLSNYIVKNSKEKNEKLAGLNNIMSVIVSNLFGAVREAKMEQDMYKYVENSGTLTKEYMDNLTKKSLKKYYGSTVKMDKYSKNGWVNRSHYYMFFYLYSYAISISVATFVASKIINGDKDMLNKYIKFLSTGSDVIPSDTFKILGVDLEDIEVYNSAIKYFDTLINEYKTIYND